MNQVLEVVPEVVKDAKATLVAHCGAEIVSRQTLATILPPAATETHIPVAHSTLVDVIESTLSLHSLKIESEQYSVMSNGMKLFGVMRLRGMDVSEYRMALGLRASNDKKFPVELIVGANIFVCDNLAFNGEVIALKRRHTKFLDIRAEIEGGVQRAIEGYRGISQLVNGWKGQYITDNHAKAVILDAGCKGVMPLHLIPNVRNGYFEPKHEEFKSRTMWSLHNAFTEAFKLLKPHVAMESATELARMLQAA